MPGLCYDVVRIILKIKYNNWCLLKKCICGYEDFKKCSTVECEECNAIHCSNHPDFKSWFWYCSMCSNNYCGFHRFRLDKHYQKYCNSCITEKDYQINPKDRAPQLSFQQVKILKKFHARLEWEWKEKHPDSDSE